MEAKFTLPSDEDMRRRFLILSMFWGVTLIAGEQTTLLRVADWPALPQGWKFSKVSGIAGDSRCRIYVAHRGPHPIMYFDAAGNFLGALGEKEIQPSVYYDLTKNPPEPQDHRPWVHGLHVDAWDNVWVTDVGRHVVMKFRPDGELVLTLGVLDRAGETPFLFNQPTAVVVSPSGEVYVADGYGNSRIMKFSREGQYLSSWGKRGKEPGDFHTPHALAFDGAAGRLYVSDRENDRIQVFDTSGHFLEQWPKLHCIDGLALSSDGHLYFGAGDDNRAMKVSLRGQVLQTWESEELKGYPHSVWHDGKGYLYVAEVAADRASKYRIGKK